MIRAIVVAACGALTGCHLAFPLEEAPPRPDPCDEDSLVLCLDFEDDLTDGIVPDRSGTGNDAMVPMDLMSVMRGTSRGIAVDTTTVVEVMTHQTLDLPGEMTVDLWFGSDLAPPDPYVGLLDNDSQYGIAFRPDLTVACSFSLGANTAYLAVSRPLPARDWYHVACVRRTEMLSLYVDGVHEMTKPLPPEPTRTDADEALYIGSDGASGMSLNPLTGRIDDVRIFARALDDAEIEAYVDAAR